MIFHWATLEARYTSEYKTSLKPDDFQLRYRDATIFKMVAASHPEFSNFAIDVT